MEYKNLLVFVRLPDPNEPSLGLLKALTFMDVTLVGFHEVPDDVPIDEARADKDEEYRSRLREVAERFEAHGIRVDVEVEFGRDETEVRERWAGREDVDGILLPRGEGSVGRVLVALRDARNADRIANFIDFLDRENILHIGLMHVFSPSDSDDVEQEGRRILSEMKASLVERGVNRFAIEKNLRKAEDPALELRQAARSYDLVVLGKTEHGIEEQVFGPVSNRIADETDVSVLVIR